MLQPQTRLLIYSSFILSRTKLLPFKAGIKSARFFFRAMGSPAVSVQVGQGYSAVKSNLPFGYMMNIV
jgi:hypothetical protein